MEIPESPSAYISSLCEEGTKPELRTALRTQWNLAQHYESQLNELNPLKRQMALTAVEKNTLITAQAAEIAGLRDAATDMVIAANTNDYGLANRAIVALVAALAVRK